MLRAIASFAFYARFLRHFSALGYRRQRAQWTALRGDYRGQRWLITGATGGIGRALSLAAIAGGATVFAAARSAAKLKQLGADCAEAQRLRPLQVDLSSMAAVARLPEDAALAEAPIDVLINNVGVLLNQYSRTAEGLETSFATNLLGHLLLTEGLQQAGLLAADGAVINMSSGGMYGSALRREAMAAQQAEGYDGMAAYAMHKRAQVALTRAWNAQWQGAPKVYVMHPGWADTEGVQRSLPIFRTVLKHLLRDADQAADTALWLAENRPAISADGGIYLDRQLQDEHAFAFTRKSPHSAADIQQYLRGIAAGLVESA